jgi:type 1 glutamine amidotransferase
LLRSGVGLVFVHHAIASWPSSPEFAELVGGRFHYRPARLRDVAYPDSGYAFDVTHTIEVLDPAHPICAGLPPTFELTDEVYLFPVFEHDVVPLLRTSHSTSDAESGGFFSADLAIRGTRNSRAGWDHPAGSDLVAWVREPADIEDGRLAYLQFGDGPVTYADPVFRRILANAISWAGSRAA